MLLSFRPKGEIPAPNDMNNLRFLTYIRNDSFFYYDKVSCGRGVRGVSGEWHDSRFVISGLNKSLQNISQKIINSFVKFK